MFYRTLQHNWATCLLVQDRLVTHLFLWLYLYIIETRRILFLLYTLNTCVCMCVFLCASVYVFVCSCLYYIHVLCVQLYMHTCVCVCVCVMISGSRRHWNGNTGFVLLALYVLCVLCNLCWMVLLTIIFLLYDISLKQLLWSHQYFTMELYTIIWLLYIRNIWWGESLANSWWFAKLKPSILVVKINNLLADLFICQTFSPKSLSIHFCQTIPPPKFPTIQ